MAICLKLNVCLFETYVGRTMATEALRAVTAPSGLLPETSSS